MLGIIKLEKVLKLNFKLLINSTELGISILHKYFLPNTSRLLKLPMTFSIWILFKDEWLNKNEQGRILFPSFWMLLGNEIFIIDEHSEKAELTISVIPFGIIISEIFLYKTELNKPGK